MLGATGILIVFMILTWITFRALTYLLRPRASVLPPTHMIPSDVKRIDAMYRSVDAPKLWERVPLSTNDGTRMNYILIQMCMDVKSIQTPAWWKDRWLTLSMWTKQGLPAFIPSSHAPTFHIPDICFDFYRDKETRQATPRMGRSLGSIPNTLCGSCEIMSKTYTRRDRPCLSIQTNKGTYIVCECPYGYYWEDWMGCKRSALWIYRDRNTRLSCYVPFVFVADRLLLMGSPVKGEVYDNT